MRIVIYLFLCFMTTTKVLKAKKMAHLAAFFTRSKKQPGSSFLNKSYRFKISSNSPTIAVQLIADSRVVFRPLFFKTAFRWSASISNARPMYPILMSLNFLNHLWAVLSNTESVPYRHKYSRLLWQLSDIRERRNRARGVNVIYFHGEHLLWKPSSRQNSIHCTTKFTAPSNNL